MRHSTYYGFTIYRQSRAGGFTGRRLPWVSSGLAADTLAGLKELIRDDVAATRADPDAWAFES